MAFAREARDMTAERLGKLLAGEVAAESDEERGALVLVALNYHMLRKHENRERYADVKRVAQELEVGWRAKGQAA
jgi:hypothetical protein